METETKRVATILRFGFLCSCWVKEQSHLGQPVPQISLQHAWPNSEDAIRLEATRSWSRAHGTTERRRRHGAAKVDSDCLGGVFVSNRSGC